MDLIMQKIKCTQNRDSTAKNYLGIWRQFNYFLMRLEEVPEEWEIRVSFFGAYLIEAQKVKSSTLKSYISAIKHMLKTDGYEWDDSKVWLASLVKSCKIQNDLLQLRLPIKFSMLEQILFEVERVFGTSQPYLEALYKAVFCLGYYGLMRVGELTEGPHALKAVNVEIAVNKNKLRLTLDSSKTHRKESLPQQIKISETEATGRRHKFFCPFKVMRTFMKMRGDPLSTNENFFILTDRTPITPLQINNTLKAVIAAINFNETLFSFHSLRARRATDMLKYGFTVGQIKRKGRWKSNAVYKYLKDI